MSLSAYHVPETMLNSVNLSLNPHNNPVGGPYSYPYFTEEETEAQ